MSEPLLRAKAHVQEAVGRILEEERERVRRWEEEKPSIESLVESLTQSYTILKTERKKAKAKLQDLQTRVDKFHAQQQRSQVAEAHGQDLVDLQATLVDLNNRVLDTDNAIKDATARVASCQRAEERDIYSASLVVLQDTKRLLQSEISGLRASIMRLDAKARLDAERQGAEDSGFSALARLDEQLVRTAARLNRAKQQLYFPVSKGYRFSTGSSGVFFAAQDLFISELSGRFDFDLELVNKPEGKRVRIAVTLGGAAGEADTKPGAEAQARNTASSSAGSGTNGNAASSHGGTGTASQARPPLGRAQRSHDNISPSASSGGLGGPLSSSGGSIGADMASLAGAGAGAGMSGRPRSATGMAPGLQDQNGGGLGSGGLASGGLGNGGVAVPPPVKTAFASPSAAASAAAAVAAAGAGAPLAPSLAAMAAAAAAAKSLAEGQGLSGAGAASQGVRPPASTASFSSDGAGPAASLRTGAAPHASPGGFASLPPFPQGAKPQKGEMVASFFSGLSKKKDRFKRILSGHGEGSPSTPGSPGSSLGAFGELGEGQGDSPMSSVGSGDRGRSKLSKLARAIGSKADRLTDRLTDKLKPSASLGRTLSRSGGGMGGVGGARGGGLGAGGVRGPN